MIPKKFRELATEVGSLLTYEATADLETEKVIIEGWNGPVEIERIKGKKSHCCANFTCRLGMMDGVLEHVPSARISVVGIYRNEETLEPVPYSKTRERFRRTFSYRCRPNACNGWFNDLYN